MTFDRNAWMRAKRKANNNLYTKKYEKTKKGFLMRSYRNMKSRVLGVQKIKWHLYAGLKLLAKEDFYLWALSSQQFHALFECWERSGYERKLTPSPDRINSSKGYVLENMQWVTHSENSRRGSLSRHAP